MAESRVDVVVCGGGAAGMAAALSAARAGASVSLLEALPKLGGTAANALIHTLGGFYDSAGEPLLDGLPRELMDRLTHATDSAHRRRIGRAWVFAVSPEAYRAVAQAWVEAEPSIRVLCRTRVIEVATANGGITDVVATGPEGRVHLRPRAVIDATGTAEVVRLVDPNLLQDDAERAAGGLILSLRGVSPGALAFPRGLAIVRSLRRAAEEGELPSRCGKAWLDIGPSDEEVYVKLFVPLPADWRRRESRGEITAAARGDQEAVLAFLRNLPEFAGAQVSVTGMLGIRDGGRIRGEYCLTAADVREGRRFADAVCRCAWPIEYWHPDQGVSLEYLPDGRYYEIPLRALTVRGVRDLWAAGKCLSADRRAHASARVVGTCWAMGEAAGRAAALP